MMHLVERVWSAVQCTCWCWDSYDEWPQTGKCTCALNCLDHRWSGRAHVAHVDCVNEILDGSTNRGQDQGIKMACVPKIGFGLPYGDFRFALSEKNRVRPMEKIVKIICLVCLYSAKAAA